MAPESAHSTSFLATQRRDNWWVEPLILLLLLGGFVVYATFRVFEGLDHAAANFHVDNGSYHYLSPFGTPDMTFLIPASLAAIPYLGPMLQNPAFLVLPFPAGFRFTCYYYRKAYYRSFVARPAGCSVEALKGKKYKGERGLLIIQNAHRYFLYAAIIITGFLAFDALRGIFTPNGFYLGLGNVIMLVNVGLLTGYTFGCHSLRHLIGGRLDCFSCDAISLSRHGMWKGVTILNQKHMQWAMASLISVAVTDLYIRWVGNHPEITHIFGVPV